MPEQILTEFHISTNSGINWTQTGLNSVDVYSVAISGGYIYAGTFENGVFLSSNNGQTWIPKNQALGTASVYGLLISDGFIYAGTMLMQFGKEVYLK